MGLYARLRAARLRLRLMRIGTSWDEFGKCMRARDAALAHSRKTQDARTEMDGATNGYYSFFSPFTPFPLTSQQFALATSCVPLTLLPSNFMQAH